jgi:hypothetical protein
MKLIKGNEIINATEKAYRVVYRDLGYKPYENQAHISPTSEDKDEDDVIDMSNITKAEIIEILTEKGIEHNPRDKKEILYNLMIEGD